MPGVVRKGDVHVGHASPTPNPFHRTRYVAGSDDTFVNGRNVQRVGDKTSCTDPATQGSPTVYCNGIPVHRIGDSTGGHGSWVPNASASGSTNVFCDGTGPAPQNLSVIEPLVFFDAAFNEPAVNYPTNIVTFTANDVPEGHPFNSEQIDLGDLEPAICGEVPFVNPFDTAIASNPNSDIWDEQHPNGGTNPLIAALWREIGYDPAPYADETAWCAVYVGAILKRSGCDYLVTALSQNYAAYGVEVPSLDEAKPGDIIVFYRLGEESGYGHVGFYTGNHTSTTVEVLGGNQSNTLNITNYLLSNPEKGWGLRTIRRAVSCEDKTTVVPDAQSYATTGSVGTGGSVT